MFVTRVAQWSLDVARAVPLSAVTLMAQLRVAPDVRELTAAGVIVLAVVASGACSTKTSSPLDPKQSVLSRMAAADALVRAGCFDCLLNAYEEYGSLRSFQSVSTAATVGAIRTGALLAIRQREMGALDEGYLRRVRETEVADPAVRRELGLILEIADTLPVRREGLAGLAQTEDLRRMQTAARNRDAWVAHLRARANDDAFSAYLWLAFNCAYVPTGEHAIERWLSAVSAWQHTPLIAFKASTCGVYPDAPTLHRLLEADARFVEIHYFLSFADAFAGRIDEAISHRLKAYAWQPQWPALTHALGIDFMSIEDFDTAIEFFQRTLDLYPGDQNVSLDMAKALTYGRRFVEALETLEGLLPLNDVFTGEAHYWRAVNQWHLGRDEEAWVNVELAEAMLRNAAVPKLAGLIAYRRNQLKVARERFELAWERDPDDCEAGFNLGAVAAELTWWTRTTNVLSQAILCFEKRDEVLKREIAAIRSSTQPKARQERQIGRREDEMKANGRRVVVARYNTAVGLFNLARGDEALPFAERILDDDEFGERAGALVTRIRATEMR